MLKTEFLVLTILEADEFSYHETHNYGGLADFFVSEKYHFEEGISG